MTDEATLIPDWTLGWRLQRSLAHAGIGVEEMAAELGVSRSTISRWVNDHGAEPRAGFLKLWALRTGVPLEWLVSGGVIISRKRPAARGGPFTRACRQADLRTAPIRGSVRRCWANFGSGHQCDEPVGHEGAHVCWCGVPSEATLDRCRSGLGLAA